MLHNLSVERRCATAEILTAAASTFRRFSSIYDASCLRVPAPCRARRPCTLSAHPSRAPRGVASARIAEENRRALFLGAGVSRCICIAWYRGSIIRIFTHASRLTQHAGVTCTHAPLLIYRACYMRGIACVTRVSYARTLRILRTRAYASGRARGASQLSVAASRRCAPR